MTRLGNCTRDWWNYSHNLERIRRFPRRRCPFSSPGTPHRFAGGNPYKYCCCICCCISPRENDFGQKARVLRTRTNNHMSYVKNEKHVKNEKQKNKTQLNKLSSTAVIAVWEEQYHNLLTVGIKNKEQIQSEKKRSISR